MTAFEYWKQTHTTPYHHPLSEEQWFSSSYEDVDSDGRELFDHLKVQYSRTVPNKDGSFDGTIVYGKTAFGFDENGEISDQVHYPVIRDLVFDTPETGEELLRIAMDYFGAEKRVYAFFHYFGMSCCGRHGKLHESQKHIHDLLLNNGFVVEHENVYYSKILDGNAPASDISILWREESAGSCHEFAAVQSGREVCWGQVHFLPQRDIAYLRWIFTDGACQHQGIGTKVMHALFAELYRSGIRRFDTDTARDNLPAQKYYEKCGFTNEGITRSYYTK